MDDSYAAGLIDGEGYIGIVEAGGSMQVRLKVAMTDKGLPALRDLEATFGGKLGPDKKATLTRRETHVWRLNGKKAAELLDRLTPMLLVKSEAARIALAFQWMVDSAERLPNGRSRWTEEMRTKSKIFREQIQEANRRGPDPWRPAGLTPFAVRRQGSWYEPEGDLFGPVEYAGRLPVSGLMTGGRLYELPRFSPLPPAPTPTEPDNTATED